LSRRRSEVRLSGVAGKPARVRERSKRDGRDGKRRPDRGQCSKVVSRTHASTGCGFAPKGLTLVLVAAPISCQKPAMLGVLGGCATFASVLPVVAFFSVLPMTSAARLPW